MTRLLGQSPSGLSATGESDVRNYYDMIAARQELDLRPQLERLDRLICWSEDIDEGALTFAFRPLWQLDEPAKAALALSKAQATQIYAGLGLWPTAVTARLVEAQLVQDGTYPNAAAVFAERDAAAPDGIVPTLDYDPAQPRDPAGQWASTEMSPATTEPSSPEALGKAPDASRQIGPPPVQPAERSSAGASGLSEAITSALGVLDPIGTASAHEAATAAEQAGAPVTQPTPEEVAMMRWGSVLAAPLVLSSYLRQASREVVGRLVKHLPVWLTGGSLPSTEPRIEAADPSPPPLTIHGEGGPAVLPGFSPASPSPGLPPSVAVSPAGPSGLPGASASASGAPVSLSQQAEDPDEKAQQEKVREDLEKKFDNIKQHVTDKDAFAAWEESRGNDRWTKSDGTPYDRKDEVENAQKGLKEIIVRSKGLLGRPRLLPSEAGPLQDLLGRASRALDRTEDYLPRGEQGTGDGWVSISPQSHDFRTFPR